MTTYIASFRDSSGNSLFELSIPFNPEVIMDDEELLETALAKLGKLSGHSDRGQKAASILNDWHDAVLDFEGGHKTVTHQEYDLLWV